MECIADATRLLFPQPQLGPPLRKSSKFIKGIQLTSYVLICA